MQVFGDDWPTPDGTCIRDYIHVDDLADAHLLALEHAQPGPARRVQPGLRHRVLGARGARGRRAVTGHPIPAVTAPRRDGDPAVLIASSAAATAELGWRPERTDLVTIVGDAWRFAQSRQPA